MIALLLASQLALLPENTAQFSRQAVSWLNSETSEVTDVKHHAANQCAVINGYRVLSRSGSATIFTDAPVSSRTADVRPLGRVGEADWRRCEDLGV